MDMANLTPAQKQTRMNIRNFLMVATMEELQTELRISIERGDLLRQLCIAELIREF